MVVKKSTNSFHMFRSYFKTAFRFLLKNKTFSFINIFGLAAGTLCSLYIILYVQDQYSYDKYYKDAKDLYRITATWTTVGDKGNWATATAPVAPAMKNDFAEVVDFTRIVPPLADDNHLLSYKEKSFYEKEAVYADSSLFEMFHFHFDAGNPKTALLAPHSVVLLKPTADKLFGKEDPVGKQIRIDDAYGIENFTVTGVVDESLGKSSIHANLFMSMNSGGFGSFVSTNHSWAGNNFIVSYVKLHPHTDVTTLEKKLPAFLNKYGQEQLKHLGMTKILHLEPVANIHTTPGYLGVELIKPVNPLFLYLLILIAAMIQLIACINFMNLSTARASKRAKEVGVRKVIGAGKRDLVKQFLSESFLLSFLGVLIALPLLFILLPYLNQITREDIHLYFLADYRLWLVMIALIAVTGLIAGSYPAFYLSAFQAVKVIKGNFTSHISTAGIRRSLVVFQFVLSIVLIIGIIIIYSQLNYIKNKDLGFDKNQKLVFSFHTYHLAPMRAFIDDMRRLPEIKSVSRATNYPGKRVLFDLPLFLAGGNTATAVDGSFISGDEYFVRSTGIKLIAGRDFRTQDSGKAIINETLANNLSLPLDKAVGTILHSQAGDGTPISFEIAGVMKDYNYSSLREKVKPLMLVYGEEEGSDIIANINSKNYSGLLSKLETVWQKDVPAVPFEYSFMDDVVQKQYDAEIMMSNIINSFTLMAIIISSLGLFGLAAFSAEQRTKEIGVRKVLGASVFSLTRLLSKDFLKLVVVAMVIATPIAWWAMDKWLRAFAYRVPITWWMFALAGLIAMTIALLTVSFQAIRAAVANPVKSLRTE
jgi:putative ABC transport system permease protein